MSSCNMVINLVFGVNDSNISSILSFLLCEFVRIFWEDALMAEKCEVYNSPKALCPQLEYCQPLKIRLAQESTVYWAQGIFQLSHELCHYAIRYFKRNKNKTLSWFEEIVCEAFSLYTLDWAAINWPSCSLSKQSPDFMTLIKRYLNNELLKCVTLDFSKCTTIEALKDYENNKMPETNRESHRNERNLLFKEMLKNPICTKGLCYYQDYINEDGVTFNFKNGNKNTNRL